MAAAIEGLGVPLGNLRKVPLAAMARTAAAKIAQVFNGERRALTIHPDGDAFLEPVAEAVDEDLVGVYAGCMPFTLERLIYEALKDEAKARGMRR